MFSRFSRSCLSSQRDAHLLIRTLQLQFLRHVEEPGLSADPFDLAENDRLTLGFVLA